MNKFIYLYPLPEYIDQEIEWNYNHMNMGNVRKEKAAFRKAYGRILNSCVDERYRKKGFQINWLAFKDHPISEIIEMQKTDKILTAGITFDNHVENKIYPNNDLILDNFAGAENLIVSGFHIWDCVEKFAKRAYERGFNVMVDEDLTEFLKFNMFDKGFRIDSHPNYSKERINGMDEFMQKSFFEARNKPYFCRDYRQLELISKTT